MKKKRRNFTGEKKDEKIYKKERDEKKCITVYGRLKKKGKYWNN